MSAGESAELSGEDSRLHRFWTRALRHPNIVIGATIAIAILLIAGLAPLLAPHSYSDTDILNAWSAPTASNLLGTDRLGRDILSRLLVGTRTTLMVAASVVALSMSTGIMVGMVTGYLGGRVEALLMRIVDLALAFPDVIVALLVVAILGPGILAVITSMSLVWWPGTARLTRSLVLVIRGELFLDAAIVAGTPTPLIFLNHLLPNIVSSLLVRASVGIGYIVMGEATLSFLGLGIQEPVPSWGGMIRDGLPVLRSDPYLALFASMTLGVTVIGFNLLGDGLRDLLDPRLRGR